MRDSSSINQSVLVTGSRGFVGRALVQQLIKRGLCVKEFDTHEGDIGDSIPSFQKIDHIFHLAALTYVPDSWKMPEKFYQVNVMGTVNILELARTLKCGITFMSSYIYGKPNYLPIDESHPVQVFNPYCHTKILGEEIFGFYHRNFGINGVILRPFNIYGPGQRNEFIIPEIINQVLDLEKQDIVVNDLEPRRDFLFIDDLIEALIATQDSSELKIYNVGNGSSMSVAEIIEYIFEAAGIRKQIISKGERRNNEVMDVVADITRIKRETGWSPRFTFDKGIKKIMETTMKS